jgi:hypothetical protein
VIPRIVAEQLALRHVKRREDHYVQEHFDHVLDWHGELVRAIRVAPPPRLSQSGREAVSHVVNGVVLGAGLVAGVASVEGLGRRPVK